MGGQIVKIVPPGLQQLCQAEGGKIPRLLIPGIEVHGLDVADVDVGIFQQIVDIKAPGGVHDHLIGAVLADAQKGVRLLGQRKVALQL